MCLVTFSRRAAQELLARAGRLSDTAAAGRVWGGTFHSVANRVLRLHGRRLGLDPGFSILDSGDVTELFGLIRSDLGLHHNAGSGRPAAAARAAVAPGVHAGVDLRPGGQHRRAACRSVLDRSFPWCASETDGIRAAFGAYTARKRERQLLDYDDLLLCWRALGAVPGLLPGMFDHVLVDEYQDTNTLQADILAALCPDGAGPHRGGRRRPGHLRLPGRQQRQPPRLPRALPGHHGRALEQNYRSTPPILAVANAVMAEAAEGTAMTKVLWSDRSGARRPAAAHLRRRGRRGRRRCATRCWPTVTTASPSTTRRCCSGPSHHADLLELDLTRRNVPYVKYGGLRFLEAAHVKDLLALLRVLDNPSGRAGLVPGAAAPRRRGRGHGPAGHGGARLRRARAARERGAADASTPTSPRWPGCWPPRRGCRPRPGRSWAACGRPWPSAPTAACPAGRHRRRRSQVERLRQWLGPVMERTYDHAGGPAGRPGAARGGGRRRPVPQPVRERPHPRPAVVDRDLAGPPLLDEDWLVLSTVHSAKGGEWEVVHVLHASDGMFPSDMATGDREGIEEERRLLYVAVTRARSALEVNVPLRYHHKRRPLTDAHSYAQVSRFLSPRSGHSWTRPTPRAAPGSTTASRARWRWSTAAWPASTACWPTSGGDRWLASPPMTATSTTDWAAARRAVAEAAPRLTAMLRSASQPRRPGAGGVGRHPAGHPHLPCHGPDHRHEQGRRQPPRGHLGGCRP